MKCLVLKSFSSKNPAEASSESREKHVNSSKGFNCMEQMILSKRAKQQDFKKGIQNGHHLSPWKNKTQELKQTDLWFCFGKKTCAHN